VVIITVQEQEAAVSQFNCSAAERCFYHTAAAVTVVLSVQGLVAVAAVLPRAVLPHTLWFPAVRCRAAARLLLAARDAPSFCVQ
jgi:hypothetical protein